MYAGLERIGPDGVQREPSAGDATLILAGEAVHRELRPALEHDYVEQIARLIEEGAQLTQLVDGGEVRALALWRVFGTTYCGRRFEVDDLVTAAAHRSRGYGQILLQWLERRAVQMGCPTLTLNSAMHRVDAHRFYERQNYRKFGYHFSKSLGA